MNSFSDIVGVLDFFVQRRRDGLLIEVQIPDLLRCGCMVSLFVLSCPEEAREAKANAATGLDSGLADSPFVRGALTQIRTAYLPALALGIKGG